MKVDLVPTHTPKIGGIVYGGENGACNYQFKGIPLLNIVTMIVESLILMEQQVAPILELTMPDHMHLQVLMAPLVVPHQT